MRWLLPLLAVVALSQAPLAQAAEARRGLPDNVTSKYLKDVGGGFALKIDQKDGVIHTKSCTIGIIVSATRKVKEPLFLTVRFENPADPATPLIATETIQPKQEQLVIASGEVRGVKKGLWYEIVVDVYDSAERTNKIGEHKTYLVSNMDISDVVTY